MSTDAQTGVVERFFETREDSRYLRTLSELLALESVEGARHPSLLESSYKPPPEVFAKLVGSEPTSRFDRVINIDYVGMAGTVLLDKMNAFSKNSHFDQLKSIFEALSRLAADGVLFRMRVLLQYPYSLAGQNRILAESWDSRGFMDEQFESGRDESELAPHLNEKDIQQSSLLSVQTRCLRHLEDLMREARPILESTHHRVQVRFACISTLLCGLRINGKFFYDPYHYGKERDADSCAFTSVPVIMIDQERQASSYKAFCNHFQYVWECDSTMEYEDVAYQEKGKRPIFIRKPEKIQSAHKVQRLRSSLDVDLDWEARERQLRQVVRKICPIVGPVDEPEVGFLAASWESQPDGSSDLCEPARLLEDLFNRDFRDRKNVRVAVLRGALGSSLSRSLFDLMDASTFSIIVLTKEIEKKFCKPNVYVELGYLLNKNGSQRTFIVAESGIDVVSDLQDFVYLSFTRREDNLSYEVGRIYKEILMAMWRAGIISKITLDSLMVKGFKG